MFKWKIEEKKKRFRLRETSLLGIMILNMGKKKQQSKYRGNLKYAVRCGL